MKKPAKNASREEISRAPDSMEPAPLSAKAKRSAVDARDLSVQKGEDSKGPKKPKANASTDKGSKKDQKKGPKAPLVAVNLGNTNINPASRPAAPAPVAIPKRLAPKNVVADALKKAKDAVKEAAAKAKAQLVKEREKLRNANKAARDAAREAREQLKEAKKRKPVAKQAASDTGASPKLRKWKLPEKRNGLIVTLVLVGLLIWFLYPRSNRPDKVDNAAAQPSKNDAVKRFEDQFKMFQLLPAGTDAITNTNSLSTAIQAAVQSGVVPTALLPAALGNTFHDIQASSNNGPVNIGVFINTPAHGTPTSSLNNGKRQSWAVTTNYCASQFPKNCPFKLQVSGSDVVQITLADLRLVGKNNSSYEVQFGDDSGFSDDPTEPTVPNGEWRAQIRARAGQVATVPLQVVDRL